MPRTMAARRQRIVEILQTKTVRSQADLRRMLADSGFDVTQPTLSRDLEELGAVKVTDGEGGYSYAVASAERWAVAEGAGRLSRVMGDLLVSAQPSGNIVVVRTPPGGAQLMAAALDRSGHAEILGTVAGDDTVLLVTRDPAGGATMAATLVRLARDSRAGVPRHEEAART